jgi:hypothetical protein
MGEQLTALNGLPPTAIMFIICLVTSIVTEVVSNTVTANILLPVLAELVPRTYKSKIEFKSLKYSELVRQDPSEPDLRDATRSGCLFVRFHVANSNSFQCHRLLNIQNETYGPGKNVSVPVTRYSCFQWKCVARSRLASS